MEMKPYWPIENFGAIILPPAFSAKIALCARLRRVKDGATNHTYTTDAQFHWGVTDGWALYDTRKDPGCKTNIIKNHQELVSDMQAAYGNWWSDARLEIISDLSAAYKK